MKLANHIRKGGSDEWYTLPNSVEIILPYLKKKEFF